MAAADDPAAALYQPNRVDVINLTLSQGAIDELNAEPEEYVKGTFSLAATQGTPATIGSFSTPQEVEVRLKGSASFKTLAGKAAFKLKFPKEAPAFLGLRKMTLNNMVEDPSMTHETLAYTAFRAAGVPASRTSFAYLYVNDVDYGLHLDIENLDKVALEKRFGLFQEPPQHLYEGENGADVGTGVDPTPAEVAAASMLFEVDEGKKTNRADLEALIAAVNGSGSTPWSTRVAPFVELPEMTRMWAVEKYIGQYDGYSSGESPFQPNNYYLYSDPSGRFQMLPWGTDEAWQERNHLAFDEGNGSLFTDCLGDAACASTYRQSLASACGAIEGAGLDALALGTANLLAPWQQREQDNGARHEYDLEEIEEGVAETRAFIASRQGEAADFLDAPCASAAPPALPTASTTGASSSAPGDALAAHLFRVKRIRFADGLLQTEMHLPGPGLAKQRVTFSTADREIVVGKAKRGVEAARDLKLNCRLSSALRGRLRARWLTVKVTTTFIPADGGLESVTRRIVLPRDRTASDRDAIRRSAR